MPAAYFLFSSAIKSGEIHAYERLNLETEHIHLHLEHIFSLAQKINATNAALIEAGHLEEQSQDTLEEHFLTEIKEFEFLSSMYFGNIQGGLADAGRETKTDQLYVIETENFMAGDFTKYAVDEDGKWHSVLDNQPGYDARTRNWYQNAVASQDAAWSDIYTLFTQQDMAIAASHPVYDEKGELVGVVGCDIFLSQISDFLADQPVSVNGQSLLLTRDGKLIASSTDDLLISKSNQSELLELHTASTPELKALSQYLNDNNINLENLNEEIIFSYKRGNDRFFLFLSPFNEVEGLNWISVVILPEVAFIENLAQQRQLLVYIFIILAIFMIFWAFQVSRIVLSPLITLSRKVQNFDLKKPEGLSLRTRFREINDFSDAFNALVRRLNAALSDLYAEIASHKESKAQLLWSETLYRSVVEDSPGLLCSFLPNGEITFTNKSYAEYYNTTPKELVGKNFIDLLYEDDRKKVMWAIKNLTKEKPSSSLVQRVYLPSGEIRWQRWVNRVLLSDKGEIIGYQAFGEDIQQEYQIQQAQSALYRIWRAANQVTDLANLYPAIQEIIQEIIPTKNFIIALVEQETGLLLPTYCIDEYDAPPEEYIDAEGPSAYVVKHQRTLLCTPDEFFALKPNISPDSIQGTAPNIWLGVPLILNGDTIGVMAVQDYENENAFGRYQQEFFEMIAPSVAATIARRRAEEETRLYAQTNFLLLNASQTISEILKMELVYQALYEFIAEMMPCDFFMISDYNDKFQKISCEYFVQDDVVRDVSEFPLLPLNPAGEGTQSRAIIHKESRIIRDYLAEVKTSQTTHFIDSEGNLHEVDEADLTKPITRSALIVPMIFRGEVNGVIQVMSYQENDYSHNDLHIVEALSSQISVARNNAMLFKQVQLELDMRKQAEEKLKSLNLELEERVDERTKELNERISIVEKLNAGMSNILHDLKIANDRAEENARELRGANNELEAFSYSVSHDLRAPIRHIDSFGQLLHQSMQDRLTENEERYFSNIFTATIKMRNLIQDLLTLSRAGRVDFKLSQIDMNEIIENVRAELFDETDGRDIEWKLATLPTAEADMGLIKVVWTNLIGNAVKYTSLSEKATIEIGCLPTADSGVDLAESDQIFFIRDNGVGFDEAYSDQLFGVFQRLHQGTEFEGNGIGLATVRRIIARHGGTVWAKSKLNEGATFYFSLPKRIKTADE